MIDTEKLLEGFEFEGAKPIDETIDELLLNDDIRNFILENDLSHDTVKDGIIELMEYERDTTTNLEGKKESKSLPGYVLELKYKNGKIKIEYKNINPHKEKSYLKALFLPQELLNASFEDFRLTTQERKAAYLYARRFINNFNTENAIKGMYLFGAFRSGKTYLASAVANELADKGFSVVMVYYPELSQTIKSIINGESEEYVLDIISELKNTDLLILDDLGGEAINSYVRDEVLGIVLNYRMIKQKPVIITANINQSQLVNVSLRKDGSDSEKIKAMRIYERIKELTEEITLSEKFQNNSTEL